MNIKRMRLIVRNVHEHLSGLDDKCLMTYQEVAASLELSVRTVRRRCRAGMLAYVKDSGTVRFEVQALRDYIDHYMVPRL